MKLKKKIQALKSVAPHCSRKTSATQDSDGSIVQAVMTLKAASNKVHEHTRRLEAVHIEFEEGGYHVQGRE